MAGTADQGQPFNVKLMLGLIAAGIVAFGAFMLLAAYAGDFRSGRDGRAHALSVSATGFKGIVDLVGYSGGAARLVRSEAELESEDLLVVAIEQGTDRSALQALVEARGAKATLLVLPKWVTEPDQFHSGWVHSVGLLDEQLLAKLLDGIHEVKIVQPPRSPGVAVGSEWLEGIKAPLPKHPQYVSGEDVIPLLAGPGGTLLAQLGDRPLWLLSDPDLLSNHGLKSPRRARAALQILEALNTTDAEATNFDLTLNGFGKKANALKLAFEPPFLALTLSLLVAALLAGLHGAFRFGPEEREERAIAFGKAALVENSAGLIKLARREHRLGGAYGDVIAEETARASGAPPGLRGAELDAYLDRLSAPDAPKYTRLAAQARAAADRSELVAAARALFFWKKEIIK
jgi:hypothetical protein